MRFLQSEPDVPLSEQSAAATRRGVPWWGAVAIAFGLALVGIAVDSATARSDLPDWIYARSFFYAAGCLLAALAVRNRALFTAAVQPPLIAVGLVVARVIGVQLKGLVSSSRVPELNSLLIKQVFAFSNDFPVILFTFLAVLTVVLVRWWRYRGARKAQAPTADAANAKADTTKRTTSATKHAAKTTPQPESAAARASRAATQARTNAQQPRAPRQRTDPAYRAAPAVVPRGQGGQQPGQSRGPAVRPRTNRPTAGAAAHGIRLDQPDQARPPSSAAPAVRPSQPGPPLAQPPTAGRRRAAPPPLDDDGF